MSDVAAQAREDGRLRVPAGIRLPRADTFPFQPGSATPALTNWEIEKVDPSDAVEVSLCLEDCQLSLLTALAFCREHIPGYEDCRVERLPALLGTRESRRIRGEYLLTRDDVISGAKFDDGIAKCCFFIDLHDSPSGITVPFPMEYKRATMPPPGDRYEIPYRCLLPLGVPGLLTAGRCISCDRGGQGSSRLQPTCMYTGEAAGIAAALAAKGGVLPHQVDGREVRRAIGL